MKMMRSIAVLAITALMLTGCYSRRVEKTIVEERPVIVERQRDIVRETTTVDRNGDTIERTTIEQRRY